MKKNKTDVVQTSGKINSTYVSPFSFLLEGLSTEAEALFNVLDNKSKMIIDLENCLRDRKAHFPFKLNIKEDPNESSPKPIEDCHRDIFSSVEECTSQVCWYLSWESSDDNSKNYRLFLVSEKRDILHSGAEEFYCRLELQPTRIYKKALIEEDISTRLRYSEYLNLFMSQFADYLRGCRISIERGDSNF